MASSPHLTRPQLTQYLEENNVLLEECYGELKETLNPFYYCKLCSTNVLSFSKFQPTRPSDKTEKFKNHLSKCSKLLDIRNRQINLNVPLNCLRLSSENIEVTELPTFGEQLKILIEASFNENGLNLEQRKFNLIFKPIINIKCF